MQALIIVDMQNDFMPGGALPTKGGDKLIAIINQLIEKFPLVLATKDWHPQSHVSFAANHPKKKVGDLIQINGIEQILWPVHCVQETEGADFAPGLHREKIDSIFYKGTDPGIDSYSTFFDNAHLRKTGLEEFLKENRVKELVIVGVATDYCVLYSVLDALALGFQVTVVPDACYPINIHPEDEQKALEKMRKKGAKIVPSKDLLNSFSLDR